MTYELVRHELVSLSSCRHSELVLPWPPLISYPLVPSSYPVCVTRHAGHGSRTTRTLTRVAAASRPALVPGLHRYGPRGPTPSPREPAAQMSSATRSCRRLLLRTLTTGGQVGGRPPVFGGSAARAPPMQVTSSFLPGSAPSAAAFSTSSATTRPIGDGILASFGPGAEFHGTDVAGAMEALAGADAVCFDVDSTVIDEEGIVSSGSQLRSSVSDPSPP